MYKPTDNEIFHVHTKRCKHAGDEEDYLYVEAAIKLGVDRIVFTDHAPFPGNPFGLRMDMEELPEYIHSMKALKKEYAGQIEVLAGLEVEYLPSFQKYYEELHQSKEFDLLLLGQHMYENPDGSWSYDDKDKSKEYLGLCNAIVQGIETGLFDVVAHPDRSFRRCREWNADMMRAGYDIIFAAQKHSLMLEKNLSSMRRKYQYWEQFWVRASLQPHLIGYDVHSVKDLEEIHKGRFLTQEDISGLFG